MVRPALLGVPDAVLGAALLVAWLFVLGFSLYRYANGDRSREWLSMVVSIAGFWIAFFLLQVSDALAGVLETGVVALAVASFCVGVVAGVRWWRAWNADADGTAASGP